MRPVRGRRRRWMSPRSGSRSRSPSASRRSSGRPTQTQGAASNYKDLLSEQVNRTCREALGRSRGGLTTKIHLAADQRCRPVAFITSEGQRHDSIAFQTVLELVSIDRLGPGRPRSRPDWVLADKAYSSKAHRDYLAGRGIKAAIPIKDDQAAARRKKGPRGGRPPSFDRERYRVRHTVERAINKLRNHRATATRYEKRDFIYRGTIAVTSIWIWLHNPTQPDHRTRPMESTATTTGEPASPLRHRLLAPTSLGSASPASSCCCSWRLSTISPVSWPAPPAGHRSSPLRPRRAPGLRTTP